VNHISQTIADAIADYETSAAFSLIHEGHERTRTFAFRISKALNEIAESNETIEQRTVSLFADTIREYERTRSDLRSQMESDAKRLMRNVEALNEGCSIAFASGFLADNTRTTTIGAKAQMLEEKVATMMYVLEIDEVTRQSIFAAITKGNTQTTFSK
jgi:hypothetical protein